MNTTTKALAGAGLAAALLLAGTGCTRPADQVSHNVSLEADSFRVTRRIVVTNTRSDAVLFELVGNFSIKVDTEGQQLEVTEQLLDDGGYRKHFVDIRSEWVVYMIEDLSHTLVSRDRRGVFINPSQVLPFEIVLD